MKHPLLGQRKYVVIVVKHALEVVGRYMNHPAGAVDVMYGNWRPGSGVRAATAAFGNAVTKTD
jgi:hypothetical protein